MLEIQEKKRKITGIYEKVQKHARNTCRSRVKYDRNTGKGKGKEICQEYLQKLRNMQGIPVEVEKYVGILVEG